MSERHYSKLPAVCQPVLVSLIAQPASLSRRELAARLNGIVQFDEVDAREVGKVTNPAGLHEHGPLRKMRHHHARLEDDIRPRLWRQLAFIRGIPSVQNWSSVS